MTEEMKKRLEEAAENHCSKYDFEPTQRNNTDSGWEYGHTYTQLVKCFITGAEYGYKEAISLAKEWIFGYIRTNSNDLSAYDAERDFESDMSKLWEEKK